MSRVVYRGVEFWSDGRPATDTDLAAAQALVGVALPPALVSFFRAVNGGDCEYTLTLGDRSAPVCFSYWYPATEALAELGELEHAHFRSQLPETFLPLAITGGEDDTLVVDLSPGGCAHVFAWMTGRPPGWHRPTDDALVWVASDLDQLFDAMSAPEDGGTAQT